MSDELIQRLKKVTEPNLKRWTSDKKAIELKVNGTWKRVLNFKE